MERLPTKTETVSVPVWTERAGSYVFSCDQLNPLHQAQALRSDVADSGAREQGHGDCVGEVVAGESHHRMATTTDVEDRRKREGEDRKRQAARRPADVRALQGGGRTEGGDPRMGRSEAAGRPVDVPAPQGGEACSPRSRNRDKENRPCRGRRRQLRKLSELAYKSRSRNILNRGAAYDKLDVQDHAFYCGKETNRADGVQAAV